ncbi:uncharacterized protein LOC136024911 isoform X2 [Artemia franciscana]|nr:hypothetical protein QYM36_011771 [Artemia franciscana]
MLFADLVGDDKFEVYIEGFIVRKIFHGFHKPCSDCSTAGLQCMPLVFTFDMKELQKRCVVWVVKNLGKLAVSKHFASLPQEVKLKVKEHISSNLTFRSVFDVVRSCNIIETSLPTTSWTDSVRHLVKGIECDCHEFLSKNFVEFLASPKFENISCWDAWNFDEVTTSLEKAVQLFTGEKSCQVYLILKKIESQEEQENTESEGANESKLRLVKNLLQQVRKTAVKDFGKTIKSQHWKLLEKHDQDSIFQDAGFIPIEEEGSSKVASHTVEVRKALTTQERYKSYKQARTCKEWELDNNRDVRGEYKVISQNDMTSQSPETKKGFLEQFIPPKSTMLEQKQRTINLHSKKKGNLSLIELRKNKSFSKTQKVSNFKGGVNIQSAHNLDSQVEISREAGSTVSHDDALLDTISDAKFKKLEIDQATPSVSHGCEPQYKAEEGGACECTKEQSSSYHSGNLQYISETKENDLDVAGPSKHLENELSDNEIKEE